MTIRNIGAGAVSAARWLGRRGADCLKKNPTVQRKLEQAVDLMRFAYFDVVKGMAGRIDANLTGALVILKDLRPGETRFLSHEPTLREIVGSFASCGFGFVVYQGDSGWWEVKRVIKRVKFSLAELALREDRMRFFVSCYRRQLPDLPNNADFYWVRGGGAGIIFAREKEGGGASVLLFKSPRINDDRLPVRTYTLAEEEMDLTVSDFLEKQTWPEGDRPFARRKS